MSERRELQHSSAKNLKSLKAIVKKIIYSMARYSDYSWFEFKKTMEKYVE